MLRADPPRSLHRTFEPAEHSGEPRARVGADVPVLPQIRADRYEIDRALPCGPQRALHCFSQPALSGLGSFAAEPDQSTDRDGSRRSGESSSLDYHRPGGHQSAADAHAALGFQSSDALLEVELLVAQLSLAHA